LEESAHIMEILFQFVHPPTETNRYRQPDLGQLPDETFFEVAEAAEKYTVFSAMNATILGMQWVSPAWRFTDAECWISIEDA